MKTFGNTCRTELTLIELSEDEIALIKDYRERKTRESRRNEFIAELNDLLARAKADGFTIATDPNCKGCHSINKVSVWGDANDSWIRLG